MDEQTRNVLHKRRFPDSNITALELLDANKYIDSLDNADVKQALEEVRDGVTHNVNLYRGGMTKAGLRVLCTLMWVALRLVWGCTGCVCVCVCVGHGDPRRCFVVVAGATSRR